MRARYHSADLLSSHALLVGGGVGGAVLVSVVALPLALSSPFPTPSEGGAWILDNPPPLSARLAAVSAAGQDEPQTDGRVVTAALTDAGDPPMTFNERWNLRAPRAAIALPDEPHGGPPVFYPDDPASRSPSPDTVRRHRAEPEPPAKAPPLPPRRQAAPEDPVEQYLWEVYQRRPVKEDSTGDFTWKDEAAAKRLGMTLRAYVIGGMDPDFREQLYHAGRAMDEAGLRWSMLSAFRDDYRQSLATGLKAHGGNSQHGGSRATGGYGHGRAIDITSADEKGDAEAIWRWIDAHGAGYGLSRPLPRIDPAHIQVRGAFHNLARELREARLKEARQNGAAADKTRVAHADR